VLFCFSGFSSQKTDLNRTGILEIQWDLSFSNGPLFFSFQFG
jgi:hypothetical protein